MKSRKIALRYAQAFFDFALEKGIMEEARADMVLVSVTIRENRDLMRLLDSPVIPNKKKVSILKELFSAHCHKISIDFIVLLTAKNRENYLREVAEDFETLYREHHNISSVKLITAAPANNAIRAEVLRLVKAYNGASIVLEEEVDQDIIGGFILEFDNQKYDASLGHALDKLRKEFDINYYIRGF